VTLLYKSFDLSKLLYLVSKNLIRSLDLLLEVPREFTLFLVVKSHAANDSLLMSIDSINEVLTAILIVLGGSRKGNSIVRAKADLWDSFKATFSGNYLPNWLARLLNLAFSL